MPWSDRPSALRALHSGDGTSPPPVRTVTIASLQERPFAGESRLPAVWNGMRARVSSIDAHCPADLSVRTFEGSGPFENGTGPLIAPYRRMAVTW